MKLLDGKQLAWNRVNVFFIRRVDAVAPFAGLLVQVLPTGEGTARQEIIFYEAEGAFDPARAVGIALLVGHKAKPETLGEGRHLGDRNHIASGSMQHHQVSVVDHDAVGHLTEKAQGLGEKDLTVEAGEGEIDLKEQNVRVTQHGRGGLCFVFFASHFDDMGRSIVLAFFARIKFIAPGGNGRRLRNAMAPAESGESLIGELPTHGAEFFMDPYQIPFALGVQL